MTDADAIEIRPERPGDEEAIADVNDAAFGQRDESRLVAALRQSGCTTISLVAVVKGRVVGHILFSPVAIDITGTPLAALGLAPMSVLPEFQRRGIGSALVETGLLECKRQGCQVVVVLGHPHFYARFGFRPASQMGLRSVYKEAGDAFMAQELVDGVLTSRSGPVAYRPEFDGF